MSGPTLVPLCSSSVSSTGILPSASGLSSPLRLQNQIAMSWSSTPHGCGLGCFPSARRYSGNRCFFLLLRVLRCFSSPGCLRVSYGFTYRCLHITAGEFPHSEICGSMDICSSPQLIAACHVLLRLLVPRHPPYALSCLTNLAA